VCLHNGTTKGYDLSANKNYEERVVLPQEVAKKTGNEAEGKRVKRWGLELS